MQYMNNMCNIQAIPSPISGSTTTTFLVLFVRAARVPSAVGTPDKGSACAIRRPCGTFLGTPRNFCATRHRRESESEVDGAIPPIYKSYEEIQQPLQWHQSDRCCVGLLYGSQDWPIWPQIGHAHVTCSIRSWS